MRRYRQHRGYERVVWLALCSLIVTVVARSVASAGDDSAVTTRADDSVVKDAFQKAMDADLSFGVNVGRTQPDAIRAWKEVLRLQGASPEQKVFAAWRIGSLYAYNFDPVVRKEKPDMKEAEKYFGMARDLMPGTISVETINSATNLSSFLGTPIERAQRFVKGYKWMRTRTPEMITASAHRVSRHGYLIPESLYTRATDVAPVKIEEKEQMLKTMLKDGQQDISEQITGFLKYVPDGWERNAVLDALKDIADAKDEEEWRNTRSEFESEWTFGRLDNIESQKCEASQEKRVPGSPTTGATVATDSDQLASSSQVSGEGSSLPSWVITVVVSGMIGGVCVLACWRLCRRKKMKRLSLQERGTMGR